MITYMDALQRSDSEAWLGAMRSKMKSMEINNVWTLVDLPEGIKLIGYVAYFDYEIWQMDVQIADRKSTRLNSSHSGESRMPSSA